MGKGFKGARGKPIDVKFNGETYTASPLTINDFEKIWNKLQSRKINLLNDSELDAEVKKDMTKDILNQPMSDEVFESLGSATGIKELIYVSLQKQNDVSREEIGDISLDKMEELADIISQISGLEEDTSQNAKAKKGAD